MKNSVRNAEEVIEYFNGSIVIDDDSPEDTYDYQYIQSRFYNICSAIAANNQVSSEDWKWAHSMAKIMEEFAEHLERIEESRRRLDIAQADASFQEMLDAESDYDPYPMHDEPLY